MEIIETHLMKEKFCVHSQIGADSRASNIKSISSRLMEALISSLNNMKKADPEAGLEVNQKPTETCQENSAESFLKEKSAESDVNPEKRTPDPGVIYHCKKCRRMLATQEFVVTHEVGAGGKSFNRGKRSDDDDKQTECPCIFVEPMKWMQTVEEGYVANKLFCMGCKARLGQFNWAGMQCSCGAWVIPAFQLTKSKIDECSM
ncbi:putative inactive dual specificity protein phosphatase-like [Panicum miliaceum]|uniref:Inactive dual specificity protein phosphatase-like n=1 Tax=Panicum miliaceum TaxID=4540 RepID=A0A3L6QC80_PANMI|nr:putative inactive dual specificity protein phosphatase-like [Panicum miliaceum]